MKITLVGDIFPADEFLSVGFGIRSQFEATKGERWKDNIQGITQDSDIVIGNLESPLLEPSLAAGKPDFYGSPEFARFLRECGIRNGNRNSRSIGIAGCLPGLCTARSHRHCTRKYKTHER